MATIEHLSPQYSFSPAALAAGIVTTAVTNTAGVIPNLNGSSRLRGVRRVTVGGAPGIPSAIIIAPTTADNAGNTLSTAVYQIRVTSSNVADTSNYTVYWYNDYEQSSYNVNGGTTVATANPANLVQYPP